MGLIEFLYFLRSPWNPWSSAFHFQQRFILRWIARTLGVVDSLVRWLCNVTSSRLHFPGLPSPMIPVRTGHICVIIEGQKWSGCILFLHSEDRCSSTGHCCSSHLLSFICWLTSLVWAAVRPEVRPAAAPPSPGSSFSFSKSWVRGVFNFVTMGTSFFYRTPTSSKLEVLKGAHGLQAILVGSSYCLWVPICPRSPILYVHLSSSNACPADFKLQH